MKSEKGIAREQRKRKDYRSGDDFHGVNSKRAAELIVNTPNREGMIEELKKSMSRRTFRRVMTYVRVIDHERQTVYLREKDAV